MVQASPFCGKASEDANAHLQNFLEVSNTINPKGTTLDVIRLRLFLFSLLGKAKTWFYSNKEAFTIWEVLTALKSKIKPSTPASFHNIQSPNVVVGLNSNQFHEFW